MTKKIIAMLTAACLANSAGAEYRIGTYIGHGLPDEVTATDTNVWVTRLAATSSGNILVVANDVIRTIESGQIRTIAGSLPPSRLEHDGGLAFDADVSGAKSIIQGLAGEIYFCDSLFEVVRRVDLDGTIHTIAGKWGIRGSTGDGGPATQATLDNPLSIAIGPNGDIFITELRKVRRIDTSGVIWLVAGTGAAGVDGFGDGGSAELARFGEIRGIAFDSSDRLHIADRIDGRVRRIDQSGMIETVAGFVSSLNFDGDGGPATQARLGRPSDVCFLTDGSLLISDSHNAVVRRVDSAGTISTFAGIGTPGFAGDGGPATSAAFDQIEDIDTRADGSVLIADQSNHRIREIDQIGAVETIAGNGTMLFGGDGGRVSEAAFAIPSDVAFSAGGEVFVADKANWRIRRVAADGIVSTYAGTGTQGHSGDGGPATEAELNPKDLSLDAQGNLFVLETNPWVRKIDSSGVIAHVAGTGDNEYNGDSRPASTAALNRPEDIFATSAGELYIADTDNNRLRVIGVDGIIRTIAGNGNNESTGDGGPAINSGLNRPGAVVVATDGSIYISELSGHRVRKISAAGNISTFAGGNGSGFSGDGLQAAQAQLQVPVGLYLNPEGTLFVADSGNYRVRAISTDGTIDTVAGTGNTVFNGDGILATEANLRNPLDLIAEPSTGRIYVANELSGEVRFLRDIDDVSVAYYGLAATVSNSGIVMLTWMSRSNSSAVFEILETSRVGEIGTLARAGTGRIEYQHNPGSGTWKYEVIVRDRDNGEAARLGPVEILVPRPSSLVLSVWPNPADEVVRGAIGARGAHVMVHVFDIRGRLVSTLFEGVPTTDSHIISWNGTDSTGTPVGRGAYLLKARTSSREETQKIIWKK